MSLVVGMPGMPVRSAITIPFLGKNATKITGTKSLKAPYRSAEAVVFPLLQPLVHVPKNRGTSRVFERCNLDVVYGCMAA
jgi:hypothetical protein